MKPIRLFLFALLLLATLLHARQPNVVLILCDDLNDYGLGVPGQKGHPQVQTPHIDKLAASGVAFTNAHSNHPICAPSRASFLTGIYGHHSKNLFFEKWFNKPALKDSKTLMRHFRDNGYRVVGTGKVLHDHVREEWDEFANKTDYGPIVVVDGDYGTHTDVPQPFAKVGRFLDGSYGAIETLTYLNDGDPKTGYAGKNWNKEKLMRVGVDPTPDQRNAKWAVDRIRRFAQEGGDKPFFLAVGFVRPHTPLIVSERYFKRFPLESLQLPPGYKPTDHEDTYMKEVFNDEMKGLHYFRALEESYGGDAEKGIKHFLQAYLACVAAVDENIGKVVDAVDESGLGKDTIIVFTSDHGWNMGEKNFLFKHSPWEQSTRVPFILRAPGTGKPGGVSHHPVSLIDLYPTLVDLCGLTGDTRRGPNGLPLDGHSVRPFLLDPKNGRWSGPDGALSAIYAGFRHREPMRNEDKNKPLKQHWSYKSRDWRYILYNNGREELYHSAKDPYEYQNLAQDSRYEEQKRKLREALLALVQDV